MDYTLKYLKYKQKYLDLKENLYGRGITEVASYVINDIKYELIANSFVKTDPTSTSTYTQMIVNPDYDDSLIIFNDNYEDYQTLQIGGGNAEIRPYKKHLRCWGIPTGNKGLGFTSLKQKIDGKTVEQIINEAKQDIKAVIYKRLNSAHPVRRIIYSGFEGNKIKVKDIDLEIPTIAHSIFTIKKPVQIYITTELYNIYKQLHDMKDTVVFTYDDAKSYVYKTAKDLLLIPPSITPSNPITTPVISTQTLNDGFTTDKTNTGSIDIQLKVIPGLPLYNKIIGTLTKIDKRLNKIKIKHNNQLIVRELHISLFVIIYNKNHDYTKTPGFIDRLEKLINNTTDIQTMSCLTREYQKNDELSKDLSFTLTDKFEILGTNPKFLSNFIVQILKIDNNTKQILSQMKSRICTYLFGLTQYADANPNPLTNPSKVKQLEKGIYDKDSFYYFKNDQPLPLYKIKKYYNFDTKYDDGFKCHITLGYLNTITLEYKSDDKQTQYSKDINSILSKIDKDANIDATTKNKVTNIFTKIYMQEPNNKSLEIIPFNGNFAFEFSHRGKILT